jgi:hypothetical protein
VKRSPYFLAVRALVNAEDPMQLIALDCPEDEYDPEIEDLVKWRTDVTAEQVAEVFLRWFGEGGAMHEGMANRIASGINEARTRHSPGT